MQAKFQVMLQEGADELGRNQDLLSSCGCKSPQSQVSSNQQLCVVLGFLCDGLLSRSWGDCQRCGDEVSCCSRCLPHTACRPAATGGKYLKVSVYERETETPLFAWRYSLDTLFCQLRFELSIETSYGQINFTTNVEAYNICTHMHLCIYVYHTHTHMFTSTHTCMRIHAYTNTHDVST